MEQNFGMAKPEGYRKAIRLMKLADQSRLPVVTFIDTPGAYPGLEAEERGQAQAIAETNKSSTEVAANLNQYTRSVLEAKYESATSTAPLIRIAMTLAKGGV